jgi:Cadherin domain
MFILCVCETYVHKKTWGVFVLYVQITYRIKEAGPDFDKFSIGRQTGIVRSVVTFDRELKNEYYITVVAEDGAKSDRPNHYPPGTPNQGISHLFC